MKKKPFSFGPKVVNGRPPDPTQQQQQIIPRDKWPEYRDNAARHMAHQNVSQMVAHQLTTPILETRQLANGETATIMHYGMRRRELIAKDFMAAAIAARIRQPGVVGHDKPIPPLESEIRDMVRIALQAAEIFVVECHNAQMRDIDVLAEKYAEDADKQYEMEWARLAIAHGTRIRVEPEPDTDPDPKPQTVPAPDPRTPTEDIQVPEPTPDTQPEMNPQRPKDDQ